MGLHKYSPLAFDKDARQYDPAKTVFLTNYAITNGATHENKMNLDTDLIPLMKMNSQCIMDLNVKHKNIKL